VGALYTRAGPQCCSAGTTPACVADTGTTSIASTTDALRKSGHCKSTTDAGGARVLGADVLHPASLAAPVVVAGLLAKGARAMASMPGSTSAARALQSGTTSIAAAMDASTTGVLGLVLLQATGIVTTVIALFLAQGDGGSSATGLADMPASLSAARALRWGSTSTTSIAAAIAASTAGGLSLVLLPSASIVTTVLAIFLAEGACDGTAKPDSVFAARTLHWRTTSASGLPTTVPAGGSNGA